MLTSSLLVAVFIMYTAQVSALSIPINDYATAAGQCGSNPGVKTSIDFGCTGDQCLSNPNSTYCTVPHNPIIDLTFAIIRFLTDGIGLVIIASLIIAGIQYSLSSGDPQRLKQATSRIQSTIVALVIFVLAYAIINYLIPSGLFGQ